MQRPLAVLMSQPVVGIAPAMALQDAADLMLAREDRPLSLPDRAALRLHLAICAACPRYERQLLTMRNAMQQWRGYVEREE